MEGLLDRNSCSLSSRCEQGPWASLDLCISIPLALLTEAEQLLLCPRGWSCRGAGGKVRIRLPRSPDFPHALFVPVRPAFVLLSDPWSPRGQGRFSWALNWFAGFACPVCPILKVN